MGSTIAIVVLIVLVLLIVVRNIYVVQQSKAYVIERLGAFHSVWGVGLHLKVPFIERVVKKVSLKEQVADFDPQPVITKDNVTMQIDTVIYFQITDPRLYTYGVEYPMNAIENLTATTLRNIIGELELDQSLTSRDTINAKMRTILDEATDPWGIKVNRVELKNILPPREIQNAMEKQMKAERERRESILQAEGEKASKILVAEGEKQSTILRADAAKQAKIMAAEAEAQSILKVQQAMADSMRLLNENAPNDQVIKLKALEAMQKVADGKATKIIIPSEIQGLAGLAASAKALEAAARAVDYGCDETAATDSYLRLLDRMVDEGAARDAVKAAKRLLKCERANVRGAALEVIVRAEGTRAMPYVLAALEKGDIQYRNAALRYIGDKADDAVYAAIAADRKRLSDEAWADVIEWFGVRHAASQTGAVTEAVGSSNDAVALAGIRAAGRLGGDEALAALIAALGGTHSDAAAQTLLAFNGRIDEGVVKALDGRGTMQVQALNLAAARRIDAVADKVKDASDTFRSNAAEALDLIRGLFRKKTEA